MQEKKEKKRKEIIGLNNPNGPGLLLRGAALYIVQYVWFDSFDAHKNLKSFFKIIWNLKIN